MSKHAITFSLLVTVVGAQSSWINPAPPVKPTARCCSALATDLARGVVWMFGGAPTSAPYLNDTWSWNGVAWTQHSPATSPTPRYGLAMVYDEQRQRAVMTGGNTSAGTVAETWEWDGTNWLLRAPASQPSARYEHAMAYDRFRGRTVLFGGNSNGGETWEWDGSNWTKMTPAVSPTARVGHAMAFHTATGKVVLFGGGTTDQTWEWDGTTWTQRQPAVKPPAKIYTAMCEDLPRGRLVLFSGRPSYTNDTWEWDGKEWAQRQPAAVPSGRSALMMAFDPVNACAMVFGGNLLTPRTFYDETWLFKVARTASFSSVGSGCTGSAGVPLLDAIGLPWLAQPWTLRLGNTPANAPAAITFGASSTLWLGLPLPLSLTTFGMPGCALNASPDVSFPVLASGASATLAFPIPNNPTLAGAAVYLQGFVIDPLANFTGVTLSNGARAGLAGL